MMFRQHLSKNVWVYIGLLLGSLFPQPAYGQKPKNKPVIQEKVFSDKPQITQEMIEIAQKQEFPWLATVLQALKTGKKININALTTDEFQDTALHQAVALGDLTIVRSLVDYGAHVNILSSDLNSPLHFATSYGYGNIAQFLVNKGADIEARNGFYWRTALHLAAQNGNEPLVRLLLGNNANIEAKDRDMLTPLYRAAAAGHESIVRLLLDQGANVNAKDKFGQISIMEIPQQELDTTSDPATKERYQAIIEMLQHAMNHK